MRVAIIGANGQLGSDLVKAFEGHEVIPWTRSDFDVRDHARAAEAIASAHPDIVINTAAFHKTEACEDDPQLAFAVNAIAVRNLAQACEACGVTLVHISTDYVFDGEKGAPYTEEDAPRPLNVYGVSKLAGERFVETICQRYYVVRVASLFGLAGASGKGGNFVETLLAKASRGETLTVVDDITMSPTFSADAAGMIRSIVEHALPFGLYHVTNAGCCTWYTFALEIVRQAGVNAEVRRTVTAAMGSRVRRPRNSALSSTRLLAAGLRVLPAWQDALSRYLRARVSRRLP
jgi:dTDP-4-dehydrorhamnose reductase